MVFVAEIKKSIYTYTHTSARTLAGGIVLLFAQNPAELRFPLPTSFQRRKFATNNKSVAPAVLSVHFIQDIMSGLRQLSASLSKNFIEKKRNTRTTCCEYMSHFIIMLMLIFGYALSDILYYDEKIYTTVDIQIPPAGVSSDGTLDIAELYTSIVDILSGPLTVPNFDAYITLSRTMSASLQSEELTSVLTNSEFGQKYGNLLTLGSIHFAPDSSEVDSLIDYMNRTTTTFQNLNFQKHKSEGNAIQYIQNHLDEYTFALIVIHSISPEAINYEIRLNYTTMPNTNQIVNWITIGLDRDYQNYFLSGFLTLQSTIDDWAFNYTDGLISSSQDPKAIISSNSSESRNCRKPNPVTMPFPTAAFDQNLFYQAVGFLLGLAMTSKG
jgi:hypothetical protein